MDSNRDSAEHAIRVAEGLGIALFHLRTSGKVSYEDYRKISDDAWSHFHATTGWTPSDVDDELVLRLRFQS